MAMYAKVIFVVASIQLVKTTQTNENDIQTNPNTHQSMDPLLLFLSLQKIPNEITKYDELERILDNDKPLHYDHYRYDVEDQEKNYHRDKRNVYAAYDNSDTRGTFDGSIGPLQGAEGQSGVLPVQESTPNNEQDFKKVSETVPQTEQSSKIYELRKPNLDLVPLRTVNEAPIDQPYTPPQSPTKGSRRGHGQRHPSGPIQRHPTTTESVKQPEEEIEPLSDEEARKQAESAKYSFASSFENSINDNAQSRSETRDGLKLTGHYSYSDGYFKRTVHYIADENGYRVVSESMERIGDGPNENDLGTAKVNVVFDNQNPLSYSITGDEVKRTGKHKNHPIN